MLAADNVTFGYGAEPVLQGVSARLARGSLVGILGPNGSGKTTILKLLAGTLRPWHGRVTIDGRDVAALPRAEVARRVAVVPQETHLAFDYTVLEIALMGRYPHLGPFQLEGPEDVAIARAALAATGTAQLERRLFSTLSGGEKQRVIIAAALAQFGEKGSDPFFAGAAKKGADPLALLLDEPTASLDLRYQLEVVDLLEGLNRQGIAIAICTHDLALAARLCRELLLLGGGRVLAAGPPDAVLTEANIRMVYAIRPDVRWDWIYGANMR